MAVKPPVGHVVCPECAHPDAEVKQDKNGHHYRYCPMCNAQYFTRGEPVRERNLLARMRPVTDTPAATQGEPAGAGAARASDAPREVTPAPAAPAAPKRRSSLLLG